jgi:hypothetical protein
MPAVGSSPQAPPFAYERELGIPKVLAHLEDEVFEGLPATIANDWPELFLSAVRPGADLSNV